VADRHVTLLCVMALNTLFLMGCKNDPEPKSATPEAPEAEAPEAEAPAAPVIVDSDPAPSLSPGIAVCGEEPQLIEGVPGSPGKLIPSTINPNGQSQLAHLMRELLAELKANKKNAEEGKELQPLAMEKHGQVRCAWPTVESMRTGAFEPMARQYIAAIETFNEGKKDGAAHNEVVSACITCHVATCDGPTIAIEAARFKGSPAGTAPE